MRQRTLGLALLLAAASLAPTLLPARALAQRAGDLSAAIAERARAAERLQGEAFWEEVGMISGLAQDAPGAKALDALLQKRAELSPRSTLLVVAARLNGADPELEPLAQALEELLGSSDPAVARGAASLAADARFGQLEYERVEGLLRLLLAGAKDIDREPAARMEFAVSAWKRGSSTEKREARGEMRAFLESQDPRLRSVAALALARIEDIDSARAELTRMADLPGAEGQLASAYLKADWLRDYYDAKLRKQRERLQEVLDERVPTGDLAKLEQLISIIQTRHIEGDLAKRENLLDAAMDGMLRSLDQHSSYLSSQVYGRFEQDLEGEYGGIGAYVTEDPNDNLFTITRPIYSGPAYKANLRSDDKIVQIDDWPTVENGASKDTDSIIARLKGRPGTQVKLYIWRTGMDPVLITRPSEDMAVQVTRELITIPPIQADLLPGGVGLVELSTFSGVASKELGSILRSMVAQGVKGVVLDLRNNSGGLLPQAQAVADLFLKKGELVVTTEERLRPPEQLHSLNDPVLPPEMPVVVLVNRFSASASEIVAGALQDHRRAILLGTRSFGKGSVQTIIPLGANGAIRLTTARYYTPSNRSIQAKGISPDILVEQELPEDMKAKASKTKVRGEASLRGHLKNDKDEDEEASGSSAYVPKEPEKDTQLQYALNFLRGKVTGPATAQPATPTSEAQPQKAN